MMDNIKRLEGFVVEGGCRCDTLTGMRLMCGFKGNPQICAHRIASDTLNEMWEITRNALRKIDEAVAVEREKLEQEAFGELGAATKKKE